MFQRGGLACVFFDREEVGEESFEVENWLRVIIDITCVVINLLEDGALSAMPVSWVRMLFLSERNMGPGIGCLGLAMGHEIEGLRLWDLSFGSLAGLGVYHAANWQFRLLGSIGCGL